MTTKTCYNISIKRKEIHKMKGIKKAWRECRFNWDRNIYNALDMTNTPRIIIKPWEEKVMVFNYECICDIATRMGYIDITTSVEYAFDSPNRDTWTYNKFIEAIKIAWQHEHDTYISERRK